MNNRRLRWKHIALLAALLPPTVFAGASSRQDEKNSKSGDLSYAWPIDKWAVRVVLPWTTDHRIDTFSGMGCDHCVYYNPDAPDKHRLVVFVPGTGGNGHGAVGFSTFAANEGYPTIDLAYPSNVNMFVVNKSADPDAFLKARENIIYGRAPYGPMKVNEPNSIVNRLVKLVEYLAKTSPNEHWAQFLDGHGGVDWSKLILVGQSQGGGHVALMGIQHKVDRVLMFGAPKDFNVFLNKPAKWYAGPSKTPLDRFFGFVHTGDTNHGCTYPQQLENFQAMGLIPKYRVVNVDETPAPYEHSRMLTGTRRTPMDAHLAPLYDPGYQAARKYMLEEPVAKED